MLYPSKSSIKKLNFHPSKKRGQNFLIDKNIAVKTLHYAGIKPDDIVVEVGPGFGSLTFFLQKMAAETFCFEIDNELSDGLKTALPPDSMVQVINQDFLTVRLHDYVAGKRQIILIASIPYSITTPILLKFFEDSRSIKKTVFIVQKEVARRLCACPGTKDYGVFSVYTQAYGKADVHMTIPPEAFFPRPGVESAVVEMTFRPERNWQDRGEEFFRQVVRASFSQRRKKIFNCLKGLLLELGVDPEKLKKETFQRDLDLNRRAETFSVAEFNSLSALINELRSA